MSKSSLKIPKDVSGRMELAEWIASKDNPLTGASDGESRVAAPVQARPCADRR